MRFMSHLAFCCAGTRYLRPLPASPTTPQLCPLHCLCARVQVAAWQATAARRVQTHWRALVAARRAREAAAAQEVADAEAAHAQV